MPPVSYHYVADDRLKYARDGYGCSARPHIKQISIKKPFVNMRRFRKKLKFRYLVIAGNDQYQRPAAKMVLLFDADLMLNYCLNRSIDHIDHD